MTTTTQTTTKTMIDGREVVSVYSGAHGCACGCRGKHSTTPRAIKTIVNKMMKLGRIDDLGSCVTVDTPTRVYVAYFAR